MTELLRLAWKLAPAALEALLSLLRGAAKGESETELRERAVRLAHVLAFETALSAARKAGRR